MALDDTPLFDSGWYAHQVGSSFPDDRSARDHFRAHAHDRRSPHPLFDTGAAGSLDEWLRTATDESVLPSPRGYRTLTYGQLRRHLAHPEPTPSTTLGQGAVSVVLPVSTALKPAVEWVRRNRVMHPGLDLELLLCVSGPDERHRLAGTVAWALEGGRLVPMPPGTRWADAAAAGLDAATGDVVVLVHPEVAPPDWPWLSELAAAARSDEVGICQPLLLAHDFTVAAAGASYAGGTARPLLAGFPQADAARLTTIPGLWPGVVAGRTEELRSLGAVSAAELNRRAHRSHRPIVLVPGSRVRLRRPVGAGEAAARSPGDHGSRDAWATAGLTSAGDRLDDGRLRWVIDIAAPGGAKGERWGDFHFATSLAAAIERQGHLATIDTRDTRDRVTRRVEDVVVVLRGLDRVAPLPGATNVLWVISHPDLVTAEEVAEFDVAFAASLSWSADRSAAWGVDLEPLLQCTDQALFNPSRAAPDTGHRLLFVGNSRGERRPVVELAQHAGLAVYGGAWGQFIDPDLVIAPSVANSEVGRLYGSAGVVLNDHWPDMASAGFVSNRLFDAVACGARVISDRVAGAESLFRGAVQTFDSPEEFRDLLEGDWDALFPDAATRIEIAADIVEHHSFDARAQQLINTVRRTRESNS